MRQLRLLMRLLLHAGRLPDGGDDSQSFGEIAQVHACIGQSDRFSRRRSTLDMEHQLALGCPGSGIMRVG